MPAQPTWFLQLPEILEELREMETSILDRTTFEKLFRVRRRRALQLMTKFGIGLVVGKTFLVDRLQLIGHLEKLIRGDAFEFEQHRKSRISSELDRTRKEIRGRKISVPAESGVRDLVMTDLPAGIHLRPGELRIVFDGAEDLLRRLFELSQAIINDYEKFQVLSELPKP